MVKVIASMTGFTSEGWISYGTDEFYEDGHVRVETGMTSEKSQACSFEGTRVVEQDTVVNERQIASNPATCETLVEIEIQRSAENPVAQRNNGVIRRANNTNWQEDPVGINVNWVRDWVDWQWNGNCVTNKVNQGHNTEVYEPTGWAKTMHNAASDQDCAAATKWSHVQFQGGQFFPACTGFKVTTWYDNVVQGLRNGTANFPENRGTGGPPCHNLLHWESSQGNNIVG